MTDLAEHLEQTPDTVRKRLERFQQLYPDLKQARSDGHTLWVVPSSLRSNRQGLSRQSLERVLQLIDFAPDSPQKQELIRVLLAIAPRPETGGHWATSVIGPPKLNEQSQRYMEMLLKAIRHKKVLYLSYESSNSLESRHISPLRFSSEVPLKALCWCSLRNEIRVFRLDRMRSLSEAPAFQFRDVPANELDGFVDAHEVFGYFGSARQLPVEFELLGIAAQQSVAVLEKSVPSNLSLKPIRTGGLHAKVTIPRDCIPQLAGFIARHGDLARAITPELRDAVVLIANQTLKIHQDPA